MRRAGYGLVALVLIVGAWWLRPHEPPSLAEVGLCPSVFVTLPGAADAERGAELVFDPAALAALEREAASPPGAPRTVPAPTRGPERRPPIADRAGPAEREAEREPALDGPSPFDGMGPPSAVSVGDPRWLVVQGLAPRNEPARRAPTTIARRTIDRDASHLVADLLNARDEELGLRLPAAGNIASALATSVRAHTPPSSRAVFVATLDHAGRLAGIEVVSFSAGSRSDWLAAAREAEGALAGATFALRGDLPHGAIVTVQLVQNLELPSGRGRVHRLRETPRHEGVPRPYAGRRLTRNPDVGPAALPPDVERLGNPETMVPPAPGTGGPTTASELPCACGGGFDLVDIGARPARVVKVATTVAARPEPKPPSPAPTPPRRPDR